MCRSLLLSGSAFVSCFTCCPSNCTGDHCHSCWLTSIRSTRNQCIGCNIVLGHLFDSDQMDILAAICQWWIKRLPYLFNQLHTCRCIHLQHTKSHHQKLHLCTSLWNTSVYTKHALTICLLKAVQPRVFLMWTTVSELIGWLIISRVQGDLVVYCNVQLLCSSFFHLYCLPQAIGLELTDWRSAFNPWGRALISAADVPKATSCLATRCARSPCMLSCSSLGSFAHAKKTVSSLQSRASWDVRYTSFTMAEAAACWSSSPAASCRSLMRASSASLRFNRWWKNNLDSPQSTTCGASRC